MVSNSTSNTNSPGSEKSILWIGPIALALTLMVSALTGCQSFGNKGVGKQKEPLLARLKKNNHSIPKPDDILDPLGARNVNRIVWQDLTPRELGNTLRTKFNRENRPEAAQAAYETGQGIFDEAMKIREANLDGVEHVALFEKAAQSFRLASSLSKDSALEQDALFFEGESYFFANRYVQSNRAFEKLIATYSGTRYLDVAESRRFAVAQYWLGLARENKKAFLHIPHPAPSRPTMGLAGESRRILNRIRIDDPTGKLADDATMALANAFFEAEMYQEAADTYEDLRRTFPGTPHLFQAHMFELKSRMKSYYGNSYDQEPLKKADELMHQIVRLFPEECKGERDYLDQEANAIRTMLADRDLSLGMYYERRGENRAARIVYEQVAEKYRDTEMGIQINERIVGLEGKPDVPKVYAQWLVDAMPKSQASRPLLANTPNNNLIR